jgi:hypothetical protein
MVIRAVYDLGIEELGYITTNAVIVPLSQTKIRAHILSLVAYRRGCGNPSSSK